MTPRSVMLLLIGFMAGLSISFLRMSVSTWGSAVGFRLPRNYGPGKATSSSSSASAGSMRAGSSGAGGAGAGGRSTAAGGAATTTTKGSSGGAPPSTVVTAARAGTSPVDGLLPPPVREFPKVCNNSAPMTEGPRDWHILSQSELDGSTYPCYWTNLTHWQLAHYHKVGPIKMCTHNPEVDTVISSHLHKYGFWGAPDEFMILLSMGPCTEERPYMLDIGANIGLFTLLGASRGCHVLSFEPLSDNIQRFANSIIANGWWDRVKLFKHAVGKFFTTVTIGFRPSNPGSSGINLGGAKSEKMEQITIDGLLLGHSPPSFANKDLPKIEGSRIGFVKVDTEGYDVAVIAGMLRTLLDGRVPHMLIEFSPSDATGTAGCNPFTFVQLMYDEGYTMYEYGRPVELQRALTELLPMAIAGKGKRVFEAWFVRNEVVEPLLKNGKLRSEN